MSTLPSSLGIKVGGIKHRVLISCSGSRTLSSSRHTTTPVTQISKNRDGIQLFQRHSPSSRTRKDTLDHDDTRVRQYLARKTQETFLQAIVRWIHPGSPDSRTGARTRRTTSAGAPTSSTPETDAQNVGITTRLAFHQNFPPRASPTFPFLTPKLPRTRRFQRITPSQEILLPILHEERWCGSVGTSSRDVSSDDLLVSHIQRRFERTDGIVRQERRGSSRADVGRIRGRRRRSWWDGRIVEVTSEDPFACREW